MSCEIVKFMRNVDIKSELYSIFVNDKRDCMLICKEHLGIFIYLFLETDRTHENRSYIFVKNPLYIIVENIIKFFSMFVFRK